MDSAPLYSSQAFVNISGIHGQKAVCPEDEVKEEPSQHFGAGNKCDGFTDRLHNYSCVR